MSNYFINNEYISSNHYKTHINIYNDLHILNRPIYRIPLPILGGVFLGSWRDYSDALPLTCRRITFGIGAAALGLIGIVETLVRLFAALVVLPFNRKDAEKNYKDAFLTATISFNFLSFIQKANIVEEKVIPNFN